MCCVGILNAKEAESSIPEDYDIEVSNEYNSEIEDTSSCSDGELSTDQEYWDSDIETGDFGNDDEESEDRESVTINRAMGFGYLALNATMEYWKNTIQIIHLLNYS